MEKKPTEIQMRGLKKVLCGIPSLSPQTSMKLLGLASDLRKKAEGVQDPRIRGNLLEFEKALILVCKYSSIQQKAVIDKFESLVNRMKEE